jgi:hypothetical protein
VRVYNVTELIGDAESSDVLAETLLAIQPSGVPATPAASAMPGMPGAATANPVPPLPTLVPHGRLLIVRDTTVGQHKIACLLTALAAAQKPPPKTD